MDILGRLARAATVRRPQCDLALSMVIQGDSMQTKNEERNAVRPELIELIAISSLLPPKRDVRRNRDQDYVERLATDIRKRGIKHPIRVRRRENGQFEILTGMYRYLAAQLAGLPEAPCIVVSEELSETEVLIEQTLENEHRKQMSDVERGEAYLKLMAELKLNQEQLSSLLGISPSALSKVLKLVTSLTEDVRKEVQAGRIPYTAACAIARIPDAEAQKAIAKKYLDGQLCRDGVQIAVSKALPSKSGNRAKVRAKTARGVEVAIPPMPAEELLAHLKALAEATRKLVKNGLSVDALPDLLKSMEGAT